jgi:serine/threonine-protein kinase/endoribonuclease IRE1
MVEITNHQNKTDEEAREDPIFIVEPSQDGDIYILVPGFGLQKLGYTVKQLAELAPYASQGYPAVAYTAEKKNTLYTVDAATGIIMKSFSSAGSIVNEDRSCRRVSPFDQLDEKECDPIGTLTIGRTEYTIGIQDRNTGEPINTIRYFEWGPNNHDVDLRNAYTTTMDHKYVYSKFDGTVFGLDLAEHTRRSASPAGKALYRHKFPSPVVRVFDLVRENGEASEDASLVVLPQPKGQSLELDGLDDDIFENVFVNCTESGSWYALSEVTYPMVTAGAADAKYTGGDLLPAIDLHRDLFTGVHHLSPQAHVDVAPPLIDGSQVRTIESPPHDREEHLIDVISHAKRVGENSTSFRTISAMMIVTLLAFGFLYKQFEAKTRKGKTTLPDVVVPATEVVPPAKEAEPTMVREAEPAVETVFEQKAVPPSPPPAAAAQSVRFAESTKEVAGEGEKDGESDEEPKDGAEPKKRKATRGKRGGRKQKEKQQAQAEARAKRANTNEGLPSTEIISVSASEHPETLSGPLQINSLVINTDKVIGQGGCGTMVFEGSWEGKAVAVKRMLSQYYELASQEVHFLQQSYHANVVRYFCQQKDNHFLYIAVELCQASLFEVWEADKARTEERQTQLRGLKLAIQQDMSSALHQLAAGLYHLHTLRIIHRDIKPQNILVAYPIPPARTGTRLVISDFGLGKNLPENVSTLVDPTGNAGTSGWKAPELISQPKEDAKVSNTSHPGTPSSEPGTGGTTTGVKRAADIFSLGCLFFWALTDGIHPFEDENGFMQMREVNIKRGKKTLDALAQWSDAYEPMHLISAMLAHHPEDRPTALHVLHHPYFWPADRRLDFLCDCSDHFEREPRGTHEDGYVGDSEHLQLLERRAASVILPSPTATGPSSHAATTTPDFLSRLDRPFVETLGKQRKYSGNRLLDLLRALRNKKNHYEDMPEDVQRRVGPLASGGYLNYWMRKFPRLLMECYEVVREAELESSDRFRRYFEMGGGL